MKTQIIVAIIVGVAIGIGLAILGLLALLLEHGPFVG